MRRTVLGGLVLGAVIAAAVVYSVNVQATPSSGFTATSLAVGRFGDIDSINQLALPDPAGTGRNKRLWLSVQKTMGASDVYVQSNRWEPGGTTGWHTHPGHSLITVTAGSVTVYEGHDPACQPHVYTAGMGFVDEGGDHVHVIRNEEGVEAQTIAVQLVPAGAVRRVDAPANPACAF